MKLKACTVYCLHIPFSDAFAHSTKDRRVSDAVVVALESDDGVIGYGEGAPRPYVSGETVDSVVAHTRDVLWPRLRQQGVPDGDGPNFLEQLDKLLGSAEPTDEERQAGVCAHHAARSAVELAVLDVSLKAAGISLKQVLPPTRRQVTYSGVITSGSMERVMGMARKFKSVGFSQYKVKVGDGGSRDRVKAVREILGPDADIRVDANGVWTLEQALSELEALSELGVTSCEEPLGRDRADALPELCRRSAVPIMLDESLVTFEEAQSIASAGACHLFNLRISKCGGITGTLRFVSLAKEYGLGIQIGSHVGETSILSAAARHLAASIEDLRFLEGSFGTLLLSEDIASPSIRFGYRGMAPLLRGAGLGVKVVPERLTHYGAKIVELR